MFFLFKKRKNKIFSGAGAPAPLNILPVEAPAAESLHGFVFGQSQCAVHFGCFAVAVFGAYPKLAFIAAGERWPVFLRLV